MVVQVHQNINYHFSQNKIQNLKINDFLHTNLLTKTSKDRHNYLYLTLLKNQLIVLQQELFFKKICRLLIIIKFKILQ